MSTIMGSDASIKLSSLTSLIKQLADDFDLLTYSDEWLEEERKSISADLEEAAKTLRAIIIAQRVKKILQDRNLVAVQSLVKSEGQITDVLIDIMSLPDAMVLLSQNEQELQNDLLTSAQMAGWKKDGYDLLNTANVIRRKLNKGDNNATK